MLRPCTRPSSLASLALATALLLAGCGKASRPEPVAGGGPVRLIVPVAPQGAVSVITRNTARVGGADVTVDAAAIARAVYPGVTEATRPRLVVIVDRLDWPAALVAAELAGAPTGAPLLYAEGNVLPAVSRSALLAMRPLGDPALGGAQVLRIATAAPLPEGLRSQALGRADPASTASAVAHLTQALGGGRAPRQAIVVPTDAAPALLAPAAGLAAESAAPILYSEPAGLPQATTAALRGLKRPSIYVLDPALLGTSALGALARLGRVVHVAGTGTSPAENAIAVARFADEGFGWGVKEPGHGLVFASASRPFDAPPAALLSATGDYGPLLLLESASAIPPALGEYLADIQPAYTAAPQFQPVRGVYNHGWLIGNETAISTVTQAQLDSLLEISPRRQSGPEEGSAASGE